MLDPALLLFGQYYSFNGDFCQSAGKRKANPAFNPHSVGQPLSIVWSGWRDTLQNGKKDRVMTFCSNAICLILQESAGFDLGRYAEMCFYIVDNPLRYRLNGILFLRTSRQQSYDGTA